MMKVLARLVVTLMLSAVMNGAMAQTDSSYPNRTIRIILGYSPGGANDFLMRLVAAKMQETWGQPVIVENRPGANSIIALELGAKAPADGYTLIFNGLGGLTINPSMYTTLPYDPVKSFVPFGPLITTPLVLAIHQSVPISTVPEFLAWAKDNAGKLNYASASTSAEIATEMFLQMTGLRATHIPFKGGAEVAAAVIAGTVQMALFDSVSISPSLRSGKIKGIAVTSSKRLSSFPDLPTLGEAGVPGFDMTLWLTMLAPAGTPQQIVAKLNTEANRIFDLPEVRTRLSGMGAESSPTTPAALAGRIRDDIARYKAVVKAAGMKVQ